MISGLEEPGERGSSTASAAAEELSDEELTRLEARVIEALSLKGVLRPQPIPASKEGGHYPELAGISEKDARRLIKGLMEKGLAVEAEREFSAVACPVCGSCSQVAFLSCRNCGSFRIEEVRYYRHTCGYVGLESSFETGLGLACPRCGGTDNIETYHKKYRCPDCGGEFEEPNIAFKCGSCGSLYDEQTMEIKPFRRIVSSREMLSEYERLSATVTAQVEVLKRQGYQVERPANLVGESGVIHKFDAVARKGDETIAIISILGEPLTQALVRLGVAKTDLKLSKIILVTGDRPSATERDFARSLGIEIVEASEAPKTSPSSRML